MKRVLCPQLPTSQKAATLPESEATHLIRVLRLGNGDTVEAIDGKGHSILATLRIRGEAVVLEVAPGAARRELNADATRTRVVLEMAVLKGEAMEWVVEKSVELGVSTLAPALTAHTVVQMRNKGPEAFQERWQKIADQSLKQCGRLDRMEVGIPMPLDHLLVPGAGQLEGSIRLWFDEAARGSAPYLATTLIELSRSSPRPPEVRLLVGPEGGWSETERRLLESHSKPGSFCKASLGALVLRAETAALLATGLTRGLLLDN